MDMNVDNQSKPLLLKRIKITDSFWTHEAELIRKEVIPYQWNALNDKVEGAAPSFCMRNFKVAARMNQDKKRLGKAYVEPTYTYRGFEALPEDMNNPDPDKFYGFVFQDTDFAKWIEAVAYSLTQYPDEELERTADEAIDIVVSAQAEDGYLDTYYIINGRDKEFTNLRDHHELYCLGHLVEGAVAYYQATGKSKLLDAARRFADYVDLKFGYEEGRIKGYPGHEIIEMALIRLYEATGDIKYFNLAKFFIEERGVKPYYFDSEDHPEVKKDENERYLYHQSHRPVREQDEAVGHAVRAVYLYSGMADVARISGDYKLYEVCKTIFKNITEKKMYITGGIGATHIGEAFSFNYDLPNDTNYAETCASIGMAFFMRRMLEIEPKSEYADVLEREVYNGILSGMALDGKSFFYVNPLEVNPEACIKDERKHHIKPVRQKWFGCACCPPNLARFLSSIGSYAYGYNENTLFAHLYIGGDISLDSAKVKIESGFPWNGRVSFEVEPTKEAFTLAVRIPAWCDNKYSLENFDGDIKTRDGYLYLKILDKTAFSIEFPMEIKLIRTNPLVRENIGKIAVTRGPVVYCLESIDNGENLHLLELDTTSTPVTSEISINKTSVVAIKAEGRRLNPGKTSLYSSETDDKYTSQNLTFIPYYTWANRGENEMTVFVRKI